VAIIDRNRSASKQFLTGAFLPEDPGNPEVFELQEYSMQAIFNLITSYTRIFEAKSLLSFTRKCTAYNLPLMHGKERRDQNLRRRALYVLKKSTKVCAVMNCKSKQTLTSLLENFVHAITQHLPHYQRTTLTLKKNNFEVIGYVRKSPGSEKPETRIRLLQQMVTNLKDRSLVDTFTVSPSCSSSYPFATRDVGSETAVIMKKLENVSGNTQGKIKASGALRMDIIIMHGYCRHVASCSSYHT
jgi:hypothetical protein